MWRPGQVSFRSSDDVRQALQDICHAHADIARFVPLGESEGGRPIDAVILGNGPKTVSLIAGAHSDEPVGPETLRMLIPDSLAERSGLSEYLRDFTFVIIPHINPDGEATNLPWMQAWPDPAAYLRHAFRELPGRDVEFGFPGMRKENSIVAEFLAEYAPFHLHISLHGMAVADGAMLLIEKHWIDRTQELRSRYAQVLADAGIRLHDHDRRGEKGFQYIGPGFSTTPEGRAMQAYFKAQGDDATAGKFHLSSMEFVRSLGNDPLCLVTELPLFYIQREVDNPQPGVPQAYLAFKQILPRLRQKALAGEPIEPDIAAFDIKPLSLPLMSALQFQAIALGLETISRNCR